jgi:hypothetical protein
MAMPSPPAFSDIHLHWARAAIEALAGRGIVAGYPDGRFRPEGTISRAEMAALLLRVFADAPPVREVPSFTDVPEDFWAGAAIRWAWERGFLSADPDRSFRPFQRLSRCQALEVLVRGMEPVGPPPGIELPLIALDDAAEIPPGALAAVSAALGAGILVNHPHVRRLRPHHTATRADVAAWISRVLGIPDGVPPQCIAWRFQLQHLAGGAMIRLADLGQEPSLVREIQARLRQFRLYPDGAPVDGVFGPRSRAALEEFCRATGLNGPRDGVLEASFAGRILSEDPVAFVIGGAADRDRIHREFLWQEEGCDSEHLAFLDRGMLHSPFAGQLAFFPDRLRQRPDQRDVISLADAVKRYGREARFHPFPARGQQPPIDASGLDFLHPDILHAVVCVGSVDAGGLQCRWLGRNALATAQCWSTTKIIPLLHLIGTANGRFPGVDLDRCRIRPRGRGVGYGVQEVATDVVDYSNAIASSNALSAMLKRFSRPSELEGWLQQLTGNSRLTFRGRYGEAPCIAEPELVDERTGQVLLSAPEEESWGENLVSVYDVTRCLAMLGWHHHLPEAARLPQARWDSLEDLVQALGTDTARYLDGALERLNLLQVIRSVVILSKMGFGRSDSRDRTELVYLALIQFIDKRHWREGGPAVHTTLAMTLLGACGGGDADQEARAIDARMAAEVTEILRRVLIMELV